MHATGLVKSFGANRAVDGVDLAVAPGEVHGLLGPNGAGKTTLLRLLFGLVAPDAGTIALLGRELEPPGVIPLGQVAGFVEEPSFYPYLSGRANLELLAELDGGVPRAAIDEALERVDMAQRAGDRVGGYSTGMRQRLGIAAALLRSPRLLLLDEPTSGLDPAGARAVAVLVRRLADEGVAVLLSSHLIGELEAVCDAYTVLRAGRVVWQGPAQWLAAEAPESAYALATSDDLRAGALIAEHPAVTRVPGRDEELVLVAQPGKLDRFVLALGREGIAVRRLSLVVSPLESMFFALTGDPTGEGPVARELAGRRPSGAGVSSLSEELSAP